MAAEMSTGSGGTVVVTGASSGIVGARKLAAQNCNIILVARRPTRLAGELERSLGVRADVLVADLTTRQGVDRVLQPLEEHPPPDWLINNAGFAVPGQPAFSPRPSTVPRRWTAPSSPRAQAGVPSFATEGRLGGVGRVAPAPTAAPAAGSRPASGLVDPAGLRHLPRLGRRSSRPGPGREDELVLRARRPGHPRHRRARRDGPRRCPR